MKLMKKTATPESESNGKAIEQKKKLIEIYVKDKKKLDLMFMILTLVSNFAMFGKRIFFEKSHPVFSVKATYIKTSFLL
jgi:hypothetical protein